MAEKKETTFKKHVLAFLASLSNTWYTKIQQVCRRGDPDIMACINGHFVAIELKKDIKSPLDPLQKYTLLKISEMGGIAIVAFPENFEAMKPILIELSKGEEHDRINLRETAVSRVLGSNEKTFKSFLQRHQGELQHRKTSEKTRARNKDKPRAIRKNGKRLHKGWEI